MISAEWRARAVINLDAFSHNLQRVKQLAPNSQIMAVVKANAYGHDAAVLAPALASADSVAVIDIPEAQALRQAGVQQPIALLQGLYSIEDLHWCVSNNAAPVLVNQQQLSLLVDNAAEISVWPNLWLKVDTGMHRLGFQPEGLESAVRLLKTAGYNGDIQIMSHFACADEDRALTEQQQARFEACAASFASAAQSMANSAAIIDYSSTHKDIVRPGIMLYGSSPFSGAVARSAASLGLQPVMTLQAKVVALHRLSVGEGVGYGMAWRADKACLVAVISAGYGDGVPRNLPVGVPVDVADVVGHSVARVSMDSCFVQFDADANIQLGDVATLWGETDTGRRLPVDDVAAACGTIAYELLTRITSRVPRVGRDSSSGTRLN